MKKKLQTMRLFYLFYFFSDFNHPCFFEASYVFIIFA